MNKFLDLAIDMWESNRGATAHIIRELQDQVDSLENQVYETRENLHSANKDNQALRAHIESLQKEKQELTVQRDELAGDKPALQIEMVDLKSHHNQTVRREKRKSGGK